MNYIRYLLVLLVYMYVVYDNHVSCANTRTALLIIDVQYCFLPPDGSLAVTEGDKIIPVINQIRALYGNYFAMTVLSQDWHCPNHVSFATQHAGKKPLDTIMLRYDQNGSLCQTSSNCDVKHNVNQTLWPDHCVINTTSALFSEDLLWRQGDDIVIRKGYNCEVDSYSAFFDNGGFSHTELHTLLTENNISRVIVTGLAFDYCVYYTSKDAQKLGYQTYTVVDASRPVNDNTAKSAKEDMKASGVKLIYFKDLEGLFQTSTSNTITVSTVIVFTVLTLTSFTR